MLNNAANPTSFLRTGRSGRWYTFSPLAMYLTPSLQKLYVLDMMITLWPLSI